MPTARGVSTAPGSPSSAGTVAAESNDDLMDVDEDDNALKAAKAPAVVAKVTQRCSLDVGTRHSRLISWWRRSND